MNLKFVIFDFDGVFTDGKCYFDNNNIRKYYNIKDGMSLKILRDKKIKTGLISSYSTEKEIYLNENKINEAIVSNLNFDFKYIGKEKKINILNNWIKELDIGYENIYSEQLRVKANKRDVLVCLSGSGNSQNIINALKMGNSLEMKTFAILGYDGGKSKDLAQNSIHF